MATPLERMNGAADELVHIDYTTQHAKSKIREKLENIDKDLGALTPASKKTLEKLQSAVKLLYDKSENDDTSIGHKIKRLTGFILKDLAAKSHAGVSLSPKAAAMQAAAFEALSKGKLSPSTSRPSNP